MLDAAREGDRPQAPRPLAVAREVERQRAVAFGVQARRRRASQARSGAAEAVQQDERLGHAADPMSDRPPTTYVLLRAFVDELARCGMRAACTSPGSRCAPLVLTLAREPRPSLPTRTSTSAAPGFFALGLAKASGLPVAVDLHLGHGRRGAAAGRDRGPRGARAAADPDRRPPAELRENGAGQAIDQLKLFGGAAKWFFEVGTHDAGRRRCAGCARSPAAPMRRRSRAARASCT